MNTTIEWRKRELSPLLLPRDERPIILKRNFPYEGRKYPGTQGHASCYIGTLHSASKHSLWSFLCNDPFRPVFMTTRSPFANALAITYRTANAFHDMGYCGKRFRTLCLNSLRRRAGVVSTLGDRIGLPSKRADGWSDEMSDRYFPNDGLLENETKENAAFTFFIRGR